MSIEGRHELPVASPKRNVAMSVYPAYNTKFTVPSTSMRLGCYNELHAVWKKIWPALRL